MREYEQIALADNVYRIRCLIAGGEHSFCDLIVGTKAAALIDTGNGYGNLAGFVASVTDRPLLLFNTHNHIDHIAGNAQFKQPFHMGAEDIATCDYTNSAFFRSMMLSNLGTAPEGFDKEEYLSRGPGDFIPCNDGEIFDLGGKTLRVIATPGHSLGGRSYFLEEKGYLYTGDAVGPCTLVFGYGSAGRAAHIKMLEHLLDLPVNAVYGTHYNRPFRQEDLRLFLRAAREADYASGLPFDNPIRDGEDARICCIDGMTPQDEGKPGYAAIVLSSYS